MHLYFMKKIPLVLLCALVFTKGHSQKQSRDYVITDSARLIGTIQILSNQRILFARVNEIGSILELGEVKEFSSNGKIYELINRNGNRQFYERLADGTASLFRADRELFFISNDSIFELRKSNFRQLISKKLSCPRSDKLTFTRGSLTNFFSQYNLKGCKMNFIPAFRFGLKAGLAMSQLNVNAEVTNFKASSTAFSFGLFLEQPAYKFETLFFILEPMLTSGRANYYSSSTNSSKYFEATYVEISAPIGLKYVLTKRSIRPFFNAGLLPSYIRNSPTSQLIETSRINTTYEVTYSDINESFQNSLGYFIGMGFEKGLVKRKIMHFEVKFFDSAFLSGKSNGIHQSKLSLLFGFSL